MMKRISTSLLLLLLFCVSSTAQISWWNNNDNQKAFLGVEATRLSKDKAELLGFENVYGEMINRIVENSAAEAAGLQPFDYLVGIDDEPMDWTTELTDLLSKYETGDKATIHFYRKGKKQQKRVEFTPKESQSFGNNILRKSLFTEKEPFLGVSESRYSNNDEKGVTVNIIDGSTADEMGLRDGDVVQSINGYPMIDWSDISRAINMMEVDAPINIVYTRVDKTYEAKSTIKTRPSRGYSITNLWQEGEESNRAFLGIYSENVSEEKAEKLGIDNPYGSYVTSVFRNSAAEDAGLQAFDYIYGIDEYRVGENQDLTDILRKYKAGEQVVIYFIRKGKNYKYNATLGTRSAAKEPRDRDRCEDPFLGVQPSDRSQTENGVRISVVNKSTAATLGLRSGDIIASINEYPIIEWDDVGPAIDMMNVGDAIEITYFRAGQQKEVSGKIGSYCDTYGERTFWANSWFSDEEENEVNLSETELEIKDLSSNTIRSLNQDLDLEMGTANNLTVNNLQLSPNEQLRVFELQFELPGRGETIIQIFNDQGRQVYTYDLGYFSGEFSDEVDLIQNGRGSYYLSIRQGDRSIIKALEIK